MTPDPLTVADVARRRKVSTDTVLGWVHSGDLIASHEGNGEGRRTYRIEEADLMAFLESRRQRKAAPVVKRKAVPALANVTRHFR